MSNKFPAVSVIIPTYNRSHLLSCSIRSVLNQTYKDFEIIVVDDASTDNTDELVLSLGNEKIRYIRHEKNKGANAARNTGIRAARGSYIGFQDSDDEWRPEKLEKQMKVFETAPLNVGVVYTGFYRITGNIKSYVPFQWVSKKDGDIYEQLLIGNFVTTPSILARANCFEKVGLFDENLPRLQDWDLVLRLAKHYHFNCIDEPLLFSFHTEGCISENYEAYIRAHKLIIEKHLKEFNNNKNVLARQYREIGFLLVSVGHLRDSRIYFMKALKLNPFDIKLLLHTLLLFIDDRIYNEVVRIYSKLPYRQI